MARSRGFTILIATDGSDEGTAAVAAAAAFPWPRGSRAHGVVVRNRVGGAEVSESLWASVEQSLVGIAEAARKTLAPRWPDARVRVVDGRTVDAILAHAQRVGARTIVLGSSGHGPIARLLVGSTSLGVARAMKQAALIVRGRARDFTRVVLGFDGSPTSHHAATLLASLAVPPGGHVTIMRVLERATPPAVSLLPAGTRRAILAEAAEVEAAVEKKTGRETEAAAAELRRAGWKVDVMLRRGAPLDELLAGVKRERAHLLVLGARGQTVLARLLLGSVVEGALHRSPISVLVTR
jgi:nucleotide-binding universal stress UspA family protein